MDEATTGADRAPGPHPGAEGGAGSPVIHDRRRLDPETGRVRQAYADASALGVAGSEPDGPQDAGAAAEGTAAGGPAAAGAEAAEAGDPRAAAAGAAATGAAAAGSEAPAAGAVLGDEDGTAEEGEELLADQVAADLAAARAAAEERLADLQRLQAEYVNYRRRVERDRDVARDLAVAGVLESLLPVLDDVHLARQHGDLESGPFAAIADKLEATLVRFGLARYGEPGEAFDPTVHEALMHTEAELAEGTTDPTVVQVLQPGYRVGERVLRPARVAVADPA